MEVMDGPAVMAVCGWTAAVLKFTPKMQNYGTMLAIAFGILYSFTRSGGMTPDNLMAGITVGLAASGARSGIKHVKESGGIQTMVKAIGSFRGVKKKK